MIPPCVELSRFHDLPPATGLIRRIGAIGRLDPQKGFDVLIPAFRKAKLAGVTLEIFGDGPEADRLRALAADHPGIVFHGHTDDPVVAIASVDAIAMPSRREPYGLVALEALAAGRPLLAAEVDGLIDHAANGAICVADLSVEAWASALRDLVATDHADRVAKARAKASDAEQRFIEGWRALLSGL